VKVIIAGSRSITNLTDVSTAMSESGFISKTTEIVSGGARGADRLGELWAKTHGRPIRLMQADWGIGRHAGLVRNTNMAKYADALVAVWDGVSRGTSHMINTMQKMEKPVYIHKVRI
jgi:hypothetical protein